MNDHQQTMDSYGAISIGQKARDTEQSNLNGGNSANRRSSPTSLRVMASACILAAVFAVFSLKSNSSFTSSSPLTSFKVLSLENSNDDDDDDISGTDDDQLYSEPYFLHQKVDHFDDDNHDKFYQRYYREEKYFGGPGHPIFLVMGGEGPAYGLFYPFVDKVLAKKFKAYVIQPEHRFYGASMPFKVKHNDDFIGVITPDQAVADALHLLEHTQEKLGCSTDRSSKHYCPVITIGGSYPGFLAAMLRIVHPDKIDMAYASSAPLKLYAQENDPNAYYEHLTQSADRTSPGCAAAVKKTLAEIQNDVLTGNKTFIEYGANMDICVENLPDYINTKEIFVQELMMIVSASFADFNMANYPPSDHTNLAKVCHIFQDDSMSTVDTMNAFFELVQESNEGDCGFEDTFAGADCGFDFRSQTPGGPNATVSSGDWTGGGNGQVGLTWDFQTCTDLVVRVGFSPSTMFPPREWTLEWLTEHCQSRFGIDPSPNRLVNMWHFKVEELPTVASHIIFTNGLEDAWSTASILEDLSPTLVAYNIPGGAHHSDLRFEGPTKHDTEDMKLTFHLVTEKLGEWLHELKMENRGKVPKI